MKRKTDRSRVHLRVSLTVDCAAYEEGDKRGQFLVDLVAADVKRALTTQMSDVPFRGCHVIVTRAEKL